MEKDKNNEVSKKLFDNLFYRVEKRLEGIKVWESIDGLFSEDEINDEMKDFISELTDVIKSPQKYEELIKPYKKKSHDLNINVQEIKNKFGNDDWKKIEASNKRLLDVTKNLIRQAAKNNGIEREKPNFAKTPTNISNSQIKNDKPIDILFAIKPVDLYPDINIARGRENKRNDLNKAEIIAAGNTIEILTNEGYFKPKFSHAHKVDMKSLESKGKTDKNEKEAYDGTKKWIDDHLKPEELKKTKTARAISKFYKDFGIMPDTPILDKG
jgi:hypothetical protein